MRQMLDRLGERTRRLRRDPLLGRRHTHQEHGPAGQPPFVSLAATGALHQMFRRHPLQAFDIGSVEYAGADQPRTGIVEGLPHRTYGNVVQPDLLNSAHRSITRVSRKTHSSLRGSVRGAAEA
jgi:hypothetical protein